MIGSFDGTNTTYYLTDAEGSVLTSFSQSAVTGEQIYGPYGNTRYTAGSVNTAKGYTGQIQDSVTGLDYYNARYYDPVIGQFLSPDNVQGNAQGADPYSYVAGNPETLTDPTGQMYTCGQDCGKSGGGSPGCTNGQVSDGKGGCVDPGPNLNDCRVNDSLKGCSQFSCAKLGPQSSNSCKYGSGDCEGRTFTGCQEYKAAQRRKHDIALLNAQRNAVNAIPKDWFALISALAGLFSDIGNVLAIVLDVINGVPILTKLIGDYFKANGGVMPGILADVQTVFSMLSGIGNILKSYSYAVWAISAMVNPVLAGATPILKFVLAYASKSLAALGSGGGMLASFIPSDTSDLNIMTDGELLTDCNNHHLVGC